MFHQICLIPHTLKIGDKMRDLNSATTQMSVIVRLARRVVMMMMMMMRDCCVMA